MVEKLRQEYLANPEDFDTAQKLAEHCIDQGWYNEALDVYGKFLDSNGEDFSFLLHYGNLLCKMSKEKKAEAFFRRITQLKPNRVEGWNNLGIIKMKTGDIEEAGRAFEKVLAIESDNVGAILNLGNYYSQKGDLKRAASYFEEAVELCPDFPDAWYNLGNVSLASGDHAKAVTAFNKALHYNRDYPSALKNLGFTYEKSGDYEKAVECYTRASLLNKADWGIQVNLANIHLRFDRLEEAKACFLKAVRLAPKETSGWLGLRHTALLSGDITSYIRSTMAVFSRLSSSVIAASIDILRDLGHDAQAQELLRQADKKEISGDLLDAQRLVMYQKRGGSAGKIASLYKKLSSVKTPQSGTAKCLVEYAYNVGSYERVIRFFEYVDEPSAACHLMLWRALKKTGNGTSAYKLAAEFSKASPESFEPWMFLAEFKAVEGKRSEAEKLLLKALRAGFTDLDCIRRNPDLSRTLRSIEQSAQFVNKKN